MMIVDRMSCVLVSLTSQLTHAVVYANDAITLPPACLPARLPARSSPSYLPDPLLPACRYTGIPGYGLVAISPDLKTWTKIGSDPVLLNNIHGIVVFKYDAVPAR